METRVKERLTGALILVAALVILVPEIFSGRRVGEKIQDAPPAAPATDGPPMRSYTARLDDASSGAVDPATAEAQSPAEAPPAPEEAPAARSAAPGTPPAPAPSSERAVEPARPAAADEPRPVATAPAPAPAHTPPPAPRAATMPASPAPRPESPPAKPGPPASGGGWFVQIGSFSQAGNAQRIAQELRGKGYAVVVLPPSGGGKLTRVRVGPARDREAALELQRRLAAAGQKGALVAP